MMMHTQRHMTLSDQWVVGVAWETVTQLWLTHLHEQALHHTWAAPYYTGLLIRLTPKCVVFLFFLCIIG